MKNIRLFYITALFALLTTTVSKAQEHDELSYFAQLSSIVSSGDHAPFWFTAQRNGISSIESSCGYARYGLKYSNTLGKKEEWSYSIVADVASGYNQENTFMVQQAYGELNYKWLTFTIGSKERWSEQEHFFIEMAARASDNNVAGKLQWLFAGRYASLGSGGLVYSGNSRPIPQVRVEIPDFTSIPGTNDWLKVRGYIAYGMFCDHNFQREFTTTNPQARYGKNILYHGKALFLNIGKASRFPITFDGGLEMHTQFGGDIYTHADGLSVSMPRKPMDFFKALIPLSGSDETPTVEQTNISGNQLGSWHAAFTIHTRKADIRIYGEHMFEDFSQLFFFEYQQNREGKKRLIYYPWRDIMIGVNIANKWEKLSFISNIRYEYLTTRDQSGALYHDPSNYFNEQMDGGDNYYNHGIYPGWSNWGMGIGNPLIISPIYNSNGSLQFASNRLVAHNIGVNGILNGKFPMVYRLNYTYSENWGTYANPFNEKRYTTSLLAELTYTPAKSNWMGTISIAHDKSSHIGNSTGVMFTLTYGGLLSDR